MTTPTREQLIHLRHGDRITHEAMGAYRHPVDPGVRKKQIDPRQVVFSKHYLEGKLTLIVTDEAIADMLPDPWRMIEERLDEAARSQGAHHRDGSRVQ